MLVTVEVENPKNYSQEEVAEILKKYADSYFDSEDDAENDINFYRLKDEEMTDEIKELADELDKMTDEELKEKYVDYSL